MPHYLFSYGTLQQKEVQLKLFGRELKMTKDILKGFQLAPTEITDEAFLKTGAAKNQRIAIQTNHLEDFIEGSVLEIREDEMLRSDSYEPENYKRIEVVLESGKKAWIYAGQNHL
jgi:hypothetical protein